MKKYLYGILFLFAVGVVFAAMKEVHVIDKEACTACGLCVEVCEDEAISTVEEDGQTIYLIDPVACTNCGLCVEVCEDEAISVEEVEIN